MYNCFGTLRLYRGQDAVLRVRGYENTLLRISSIKNRLEFLRCCLKNQVLPRSFKNIENADGTPFGKLQHLLLENAITLLSRDKDRAHFEYRTAFSHIEDMGFDRYVSGALDHIRKNVSLLSIRHKLNLDHKFETIFSNSAWIKFSQIENVKNLSDRLLSRDEKVVLGLGLNFCLGQGKNFYTDFNSKVNAINNRET